MAKVIDLDVLVNEPIEFIIGGTTYEIPSSPTTDLLIKFMGIDKKRGSVQTEEEQVRLLDDLCHLILSQDMENKVTKDFVSKKLSFSQKIKIIEVFKSSVSEVENNPN